MGLSGGALGYLEQYPGFHPQALHKPGLVVHARNPSTLDGRQASQKFMIIRSYVVSLRPA